MLRPAPMLPGCEGLWCTDYGYARNGVSALPGYPLGLPVNAVLVDPVTFFPPADVSYIMWDTIDSRRNPPASISVKVRESRTPALVR